MEKNKLKNINYSLYDVIVSGDFDSFTEGEVQKLKYIKEHISANELKETVEMMTREAADMNMSVSFSAQVNLLVDMLEAQLYQNDFENELSNAVGEYLEQIESGKVNGDKALYDLIIGSKHIGCSTEAKVLIKRILSLKKKLDVSDDELKKIISGIGFSDSIPLEVRLYFVREHLQEQYGKRRKN